MRQVKRLDYLRESRDLLSTRVEKGKTEWGDGGTMVQEDKEETQKRHVEARGGTEVLWSVRMSRCISYMGIACYL